MRYFIIENNQQQGPFSIYELRDKNISSETLVWSEGMPDWTPAWKVDELRRFLYNSEQTPTPPPYVPPTNIPHVAATPPVQEVGKQPKRRKTGLILGGICAFLVLICVFTNPSKQTHKDTIKEHLAKAIAQESSASTDIFEAGMAMMGQLIAGRVIETTMDHLLNYHNYLLWSTTSVEWNGNTHTTSYGILGHVFTADEQDMVKLLKSHKGNFLEKEFGFGNTNTQESDAQEQEETESTEGYNEQTDNNLSDKIVSSVGQMVKDKVSEETDSTTSEGIGKLIDYVIDFIKGSN